MSSYKKYIIVFLVIFISACTATKVIQENNEKKFKLVNKRNFSLENLYIMYALEYEGMKDYTNAINLYGKLFVNTNNYEYLLKQISLYYFQKDYENIVNIIDDKVLKDTHDIKEEEGILRVYVLSLLSANRDDEALEIANRLLNSYKNAKNYQILGRVYLSKKEYKKAYDNFIKAYDLDKNIDNKLTAINIQYNYLNQKHSAKSSLNDYIKKNNYPFFACLQLLAYYEKDNNKKDLFLLLEKMYVNYKKDNRKSFKKVKKLLIGYYLNNNIENAINFLEQNDEENTLLLKLYRQTNKQQKAYLLLNKLYLETSNYDYLAQMAILEFEMAKNKKMVINSVIGKFEKVLKVLSNPMYENYLAYILIDYDKNIIKGLDLVKKALKKEPDNIAYLDTLAWGEYKINNCNKAYKIMKNIITNMDTISDDEIKLHWKKIKECKK